MKPTVTFFSFLIFFQYGIIAQNSYTSAAKLSPLTKKYLHEQTKNSGFSNEYVRKKTDGKYYLSAIIKVNHNVDENAFSNLKVHTGTKAGNIWTVQIPEENLNAFTKLKGVNYIQLDEPVYISLDSARHDTHADSVHEGTGLPQAYSGKNVVVGIIDAGFDYTHPSLMDTAGNIYRVKKVWEQKSAGTPPAGYIYGNEIGDSLALWNDGYDINFFSHGAHVAGIAAGSGLGSSAGNNRFRGFAYESDIVIVGIRPEPNEWTSTGLSSIIDGMAYVFNYAASVGKPAVVNLSWGCSVGPHDGTSLFSQAVDNLTGTGKIFVCAAGNNGSDNIHLRKTFTQTDTLIKSCISFSTYAGSKKTWVDIWGDASKSFCVSVTMYNGSVPGNSTGFICPDDSIHSLFLKGTAGDTCFVTIIASPSDFNGKPRISLDFYSKSTNKILITIKGTDGTVNAWIGYVKDYTGYYGAFVNGGIPGSTTGNKEMTVSDISSTHSAIAVAAYASKTTYINIDGQPFNYSSYVSEGKITPFSSRGPAADSAVKPDIAAPGMTLGSGINSFDTSYYSGAPYREDVITCYNSPLNGRDYCYAMMIGTSMASPVVSGIVALMLQVNPALTPQFVKNILRQTAITDNFTGTIPSSGSYLWGFGKVNAYAAVKKTWQTVNVNNISNADLDYMIYPSPNSGNFNLDYISEIKDNLKIEITDMPGNLVYTKKLTVNSGLNPEKISFSGMAKGIYFVKLSAAKGMSVFKMIVE